MHARLTQPQLAALSCVLSGQQPSGTRRSDLVRLEVCDLVRLQDAGVVATARARQHRVVVHRDRLCLVRA